MPAYNIFADLNGDDFVASADLIPLSNNFLRALPPGDPEVYDFSPTRAALPRYSLPAAEADQFFLGFAAPTVFQEFSNDDGLSSDPLIEMLQESKTRDKRRAYMA